VIAGLNEAARKLPVVFPVHPRTRKMMADLEISSDVRVTAPLGYLDFLSLEADAAAVLTDSGGVQEETTFLGVPCFTLRESTERPVTIRMGTNHLLGLDPGRIGEAIESLATDTVRPAELPPLWDGHAAERIAEILAGSPSTEIHAGD
jgi:UDP-N-acetylglucosamine 2-epimerase (non-hydrolysing)